MELRRSLKLLFVALLLLLVGQGSALAAPTRWDYVALGDSLAAGLLASEGYVPRYEVYTETDTGVPVRLTNLGRIGWTSTDLLGALRNSSKFRSSVRRAEVVTINIGGNDLRAARDRYKDRACGGSDNQRCLRITVRRFKSNWQKILAEVRKLRSTGNTVIRTMDIYNPYVGVDRAADTWASDGGKNDFQVFKRYLDEVNRHIARTSNANNIPHAGVYRAFNGPRGNRDPRARGYISFDGLHPNDRGHKVIADRLRNRGYVPLV
jgi:lysophospholipase L1-like esterase